MSGFAGVLDARSAALRVELADHAGPVSPSGCLGHTLDAPPERLDGLRGRFALAAWDTARTEALLAVDQLAARQLYFHLDGSVLTFSTEIRGLLRLLPRQPAPDLAAASSWLLRGFRPAGRTFYEGVRQLRAGHALRLEDGRWREERYWEPEYRPPLELDRRAQVEAVIHAIEAAVARRLPSGTSGAVRLSGGVDSSSLTALTCRSATPHGRLLGGYTAVFPRHPEMDEAAKVEQLTASLELPSRQLAIEGGSMLAPALEFLQAFGEPTPSPNLLILRPLLELAAADGAEVVLDGEGGDELFGVAAYLVADRLRSGRLLGAANVLRRFPGFAANGGLRPALTLLREYGLYGLAPSLARSRANRPDWLTERAAELAEEAHEPDAWRRRSGPLWWREKVDELVDQRERAGAHEFMRRLHTLAEVEGEHPFLDDLDLVELVLRLPPESAFDPRFDRPLLREAVAGLVPDDVRLRRGKSYFDALFQESLSGVDHDAIARLLGPGAETAALVDPARVREQLVEAPTERRGGRWAWTLWRLTMLECWLRSQSDPGFAERVLETWGLAEARVAPLGLRPA